MDNLLARLKKRAVRLCIFVVLGACISVTADAAWFSSKKKQTTSNASSTTTTNTQTNLMEKAQNEFSDISLIFIQTSGYAVINPLEQNSNTFLFTLYDVSPYITYFTQRPQKLQGLTPVGQFVQAWSVGENSFNQVNPNAVVTSAKIDGAPNAGQMIILFTLSNPKYDSTKNILQFTASPLRSENLLLKRVRLDGVTLVIGS